ncbi:hypothetical protein AAF712_015829 [Marasmius tenuissimus]|uniref:CAP-Gly domain-containing protein n=1 Tax=Marasmius tenuissimus TaxID=585030 RepID=A0ABR2Z9H0_9AGAR
MDKGQDSQIYCRTLYSLGHGCALWGPEPNDDLPSEYRESGTRVGDVGVVTSDGRFDFLFNICLPEDDPVNQYNGVPPGFTPLRWDKKCLKTIRWFRPQKPICSKDSTQWNLELEGTASMFGLPVGVGGGIGVIFNRERGAVVMPGMDGADRTDASNKALFIKYAARHGVSWYEFVNGTLGREADNGELYLITGFDKTNAWENAVVYNHSTTKSCYLAFTSGGLGADGRLKLSTSTSHESSLISRCSSDEGSHNQSLFIRGFRISVRQGIRAKFGSKVKVTSMYRSTPGEVLDKVSGGIPFGGTSSSNWSPGGSPASGGSSLSLESFYSMSDSDSNLSSGESATSIEDDDFAPDTKIHHPLVAINEYVLQTRADSTVVVSHDDDWISLLSEQDGYALPDDATLIERFRRKLSVVVNAHGSSDTIKTKGGTVAEAATFTGAAKATPKLLHQATLPQTPKEPPAKELPDHLNGATIEIGIPCIIQITLSPNSSTPTTSNSSLTGRKKLKALVKYIGQVEGEEGSWVGVEILSAAFSSAFGGSSHTIRDREISDSGMSPPPPSVIKATDLGWHDGTYQGIRYFTLSPPTNFFNKKEQRVDEDETGGHYRWADRKFAGAGVGMVRKRSGNSEFENTVGRDIEALKTPTSDGVAEKRGLFVRPEEVLHVVGVDGVDDDL